MVKKAYLVVRLYDDNSKEVMGVCATEQWASDLVKSYKENDTEREDILGYEVSEWAVLGAWALA